MTRPPARDRAPGAAFASGVSGAALVLIATLFAAFILVPAALAARAPRTPVVTLDVRFADRTAAAPASPARDATLRGWTRTASLEDLLYVLRRPAAELGRLEADLVRAALARCPAARADLRRQLVLRLALADPAGSRKELGALAALVPELPVRPRASIFRLGLLMPDTGSYASYGRAVRAGVDAALADANSVSLHPIEVELWSTGGDAPDRAAAAVDHAANSAGVLVGELLSVSTFAIASSARLLRVPLLSPTATDEGIGRVGPSIFQIGPSGARRGVALGRSMLRPGMSRAGVLIANDLGESPLAHGFQAIAESLGIEIAWRGSFTPGAPDLRALARAIGAQKLDALMFDGEPGDARVFLGALARAGVSLAIGGGEAFAPESHAADARLLLEGVAYVGEDWTVPAGVQARLDSVATEIGEARGTSLFVRGYYAGRLISSGVHSGGALAPEELTAWLRRHLDPLPAAGAAGFLDCISEHARLPVWTVQRGKAVPAP